MSAIIREITIGDCRLVHGDCMAILPSLQPVDAVVTDPPYQQTSLAWDIWPAGWPDAVATAIKPTGSMWCFGTLRMFTDRWTEFSGWRMAQDVIWEKHNGSSLQNDRFRRVHEQAVQFYRGGWSGVYKGRVVTMDATARTVRRKGRPEHWGGIADHTFRSEDGGPRLMRSVIFARSQHGQAIHPTQKPEAIIEPLVINSCPPGGTVLDPFGGSGTTGFVALRTGRRAIIIEAREDYFDAMVSRFRAELMFANEATP